MKIDYEGRVVLVTGASRGIGAALARAFADAGARVALHYGAAHGPAQALAEEIGPAAELFQADLGDAEGCGQLWADVVERYGRVHALVNNAGVAIGSRSEEHTSELQSH